MLWGGRRGCVVVLTLGPRDERVRIGMLDLREQLYREGSEEEMLEGG